MEAVKAQPVQPTQRVKAAEAPKRVDQQSNPVEKIEAVAAKKALEQMQRPTTNTRGETLGRHLNVTA